MSLPKLFIFAILAIICVPLMFLVGIFYGDGKEGSGFFQTVWSKGKWYQKAYASIIAIPLFTIVLFLNWTNYVWEKIAE